MHRSASELSLPIQCVKSDGRGGAMHSIVYAGPILGTATTGVAKYQSGD